ncbi:MAG: hypothetical protein GY853_09630 [PVC group bacterium]|nr:hypothetical protein [PVC group bacterium]
MKIILANFHQILTGNLKPWLKDIATKEQYKVWSSELPAQALTYPNVFTLKFIKPFSPKTIYYAGLITSSATEYTNEVKSLFFENESENIRINLVYNSLKKELFPLLETISEIIQHNYGSEYIDIDNLKKTDQSHKENTHIIHFLKATAIQLFLEVQNMGIDYLRTEILVLEDIHYQFFNETVPQFYSITKQEKHITPKKEKAKKEKPIYHSFKLKNYVREHSKLIYLWEPLKKDGIFIAEDTKLTDFKKIFSGDPIENKITWTGNKSELAYFIKRIHNVEKLVEHFGQEHWTVTIKCFLKEDGTLYERGDFRELKKPAKANLIIRAINSLK